MSDNWGWLLSKLKVTDQHQALFLLKTASRQPLHPRQQNGPLTRNSLVEKCKAFVIAK